MPKNPAATAALNDSPAATIKPPLSMMPGLIRKLNMMLKRSNQPAVLALFRNGFDAELLDAGGLAVARAQAALDVDCGRQWAIPKSMGWLG